VDRKQDLESASKGDKKKEEKVEKVEKVDISVCFERHIQDAQVHSTASVWGDAHVQSQLCSAFYCGAW
jgi:hypothetical protein